MPGISCHDATQGTKGRKRLLSKLSILYGDFRVVCFQEGREEISQNLKMIRRVEVAREARKAERKENSSSGLTENDNADCVQ